MATQNARGGWDLTDDDLAEVMSASFGQQDTPHLPECQPNLRTALATADKSVCLLCEALRMAHERGRTEQLTRDDRRSLAALYGWRGGEEAEALRVENVIADHYKVAPKAAEPLLRALGYWRSG